MDYSLVGKKLSKKHSIKMLGNSVWTKTLYKIQNYNEIFSSPFFAN